MDKLDSSGTSINKYISRTGICSRREADQLLKEGKVTLNGVVAKPGNRVMDGDVVKLNGKSLKARPKAVYLALNKPPGITCTTDRKDKSNIVDFMKYPERIFHIGRLDKPSEGLILMTNDGDIVNKILRATNRHEKEYIVEVTTPITNEFVKRMAGGLPILGKKTRKCKVEKINSKTFKIILTEGLNRQIRRMCEYLDYKVVRLKRVRIMNIQLGNLPKGQYRELTQKETLELMSQLKGSVKN